MQRMDMTALSQHRQLQRGSAQSPRASVAHRCACSGSPTSVMSPSGPTMQRVDVTTFSRSGSSGGLVTCA